MQIIGLLVLTACAGVLFVFGATVISFESAIVAGYEYMPSWFVAYQWHLVFAIVLSWAISTNRKGVELLAALSFFGLPLFLYLLVGGGHPDLEVRAQLESVGWAIALATTALALIYAGYAVIARIHLFRVSHRELTARNQQ